MFSVYFCALPGYILFDSSSPGMLLLIMKFLPWLKNNFQFACFWVLQQKRKRKVNSSLTSTNSFTTKWCESVGMRGNISTKNLISVEDSALLGWCSKCYQCLMASLWITEDEELFSTTTCS